MSPRNAPAAPPLPTPTPSTPSAVPPVVVALPQVKLEQNSRGHNVAVSMTASGPADVMVAALVALKVQTFLELVFGQDVPDAQLIAAGYDPDDDGPAMIARTLAQYGDAVTALMGSIHPAPAAPAATPAESR